MTTCVQTRWVWIVLLLLFTGIPARMFAAVPCLAGSGTCSDQFNGASGTLLTNYSSSWIKAKGTSDAYLTGTGTVAIPGNQYAYYYFAPSTSDVSQITVQASSTKNAYTREACVRVTPGLGGYCVGFGSVSSGNYYNCYLEKGGQGIGNASCGLVSATVSHTLAVVASGTAPVLLSVYLDGRLTGTVTDTTDTLTVPRPGFALVGDTDVANNQASLWQDYQGAPITTTTPDTAVTAYGCSTGTGTCYDNFAGGTGTKLVTYNPSWTLLKGISDAYLTGNKSIQVPGYTYAYYSNTASQSDTSQITVSASTVKSDYAREACVRLQKNVGGYCVGFGGVTNGVYNNCFIEKGGSYLGAAACGTPGASASHTLAITATGTSPVTLQVYLDGAPMQPVIDKYSTYTVARPGLALISTGLASDTDTGRWQDYLDGTLPANAATAAAPVFSPAAGTYIQTQQVTLTSSTLGAMLRYTIDGSIPTATSALYAGPITVASSSVIKAIATATGKTTSGVSSAAYTIAPPAATPPVPTFSVPSPYSGTATNVAISDSAAGASILYCQDTANSCTPSVSYTGAISFASSGYIRAKAVLAGVSSAIAVWQGTWSTAQIITSSCPEGTQYTTYTGCTITVSGGLAPYTFGWSKTSGNGLVEGLQLNPVTGVISGTVYGQGVYSIPFTVTDATNSTVTKVVTLPVRGDNTLGGCSLFPADSIWHLNVAGLPVDTSPAAPILPDYLNSSLHMVFGSNLGDGGIPFLRVPYNQANVPVSTTLYQSYFSSGPFPTYAPIEGTLNSGADADRHVAILQTAGGGNNCKLWEMWQGQPTANGWTDSSNAFWDLGTYDMLPQDNGSTDAAGLPITPLLWNYDEVAGACRPGAECGVVKHPARLTLNHTLHRHVWPATAQSGLGGCTGGYSDDNRLLSQSVPPTSCSGSGPMGEIYRLKSGTAAPASCVGHPQAQVLITALRNYGLIIADNGITGGVVATADSRWNDADLACLINLHLSDFEPVNVSGKMIDLNSSQVKP